jgi:hypothetical protein
MNMKDHFCRTYFFLGIFDFTALHEYRVFCTLNANFTFQWKAISYYMGGFRESKFVHLNKAVIIPN